MGLSFWLVPTLVEQQTILQEEMKTLREANATITSAYFPPHVTLIAGLNAEQGWEPKNTWNAFLSGLSQWKQEQSGENGPIECELNEVTTRGMYFQCILLALEKQSSLLSLNAQMRRTFTLHDQPDYFPHASLLYASLSSKQAEKQIQDMQRNGVFFHSKGRITFGSGDEKMSSITLGAIEFWDSNGPVEQWKRLERVEL